MDIFLIRRPIMMLEADQEGLFLPLSSGLRLADVSTSTGITWQRTGPNCRVKWVRLMHGRILTRSTVRPENRTSHGHWKTVAWTQISHLDG